MKFFLCILFIAVSRETVAEVADDDLVVNLTKPIGRVRGKVLKTYTGKEYIAFQEIPYAQPPIGRHRVTVPKRHPDWHYILNTTTSSRICMQTLKKNPFNLNVTEDCLFLNIYTPKLPSKNGQGNETLLPVIFWIHPGNFQEGGGVFQYYNPQFLIEYDIIVVTINYRLGPFGFVWGGDEIIQGNMGLLDQLQAFNWVFDNIQKFGGDPFNTAMVGHGSGAASICYHATNIRARALLYNSAILMSGSCVSPVYYQPQADKYAFSLGKKLDSRYTSNDTSELRDLLRMVTAEQILKAGNEVVEESHKDTPVFQRPIWLPVVEGFMNYNPYIVWPPLDAWTSGTIRITATMMGFTSGEMVEWAANNDLLDLAEKFDKDPSLLINPKLQIPPEKKLEAGQEMKKLYTSKDFKSDKAALMRYLNDQITIPIIKQAYNSSWYNINFLYQFSYKGKLNELKEGETNVKDGDFDDDVPHGAILKYIWDDGTNSDPTKYTPEDRLMQKRILTIISNFVRYRNPTPNADPLFNNTLWPPNDNDYRQTQYINIGKSIKAGENPRDFQKFDDLLDKYIDGSDPIAVF